MSQSQTHNSKERELDSHSLISFHIFIVFTFHFSERVREKKREKYLEGGSIEHQSSRGTERSAMRGKRQRRVTQRQCALDWTYLRRCASDLR